MHVFDKHKTNVLVIPFNCICRSSCIFSNVLKLDLSSGIICFLFQLPQAYWKKSAHGSTDVSMASINNVAELKKINNIKTYYCEICLKWALSKTKFCINRTSNKFQIPWLFINLSCINPTPVYIKHNRWFEGVWFRQVSLFWLSK